MVDKSKLSDREKVFYEYYETHDDNEYTMLGQIELFDEYSMESVIGALNLGKKTKTVTVELYNREGWEKPHLHVYNDYFKCAIRLDINQYFKHGYHQDTLNDSQAKKFDAFMREKIPYTNNTNWTFAVTEFNRQFPDKAIKVKEQPDYTKLNYTVNLKDDAESKKKGKKKK